MRVLRRRREKGQAFVEYVILVAVIALAALFVLANFSDRLKEMITGITVTLGGEADESADLFRRKGFPGKIAFRALDLDQLRVIPDGGSDAVVIESAVRQ